MDQKSPNITLSSPPYRDASNSASVRMKGSIREILLAFAVMTIPMIAFSALLLGLIEHFRISQNAFISDNLRLDTHNQDPSAVFVNISATTLITIASWSSTLAPLLIASALTLASYPVARKILLASQSEDMNSLPTPYQFTLLLRMVSNSSPSSLWHWLKYCLCWRGKRESQSKPLRSMSFVFLIGTILSSLVFLADTWLHFTTKTVVFVQIEPVEHTSLKHNFALKPDCLNVNKTFFGGCTLNPAATATFLMDSSETLGLLVNTSTTANIGTFTKDHEQYAYLGVPALPAIADIDYTATSYAVKSTCQPVTKECFWEERISGPGAWYSCPFAMQDWIATGPINTIKWEYFTDATGQENNTVSNAIANPYYYAAIFSVNQNIGWKPYVGEDPQMANGLHGSTLFAAMCEATVYDVDYTVVNHTITRFETSLSNMSVANILQGTQHYTEVGSPFVIQASSVAAALAVAAGATVPTPATEAQRRREILVARVPKAPLIVLLVSCFLIVLLGVILTILASVSVQGDTGEVQARLSIPGLVAAHFERHGGSQCVEYIDKLFEESQGIKSRRIGVQQNHIGGWTFG
ncbi:hypothetical protein BKA66DRAFT_447756 [Pyrenochaeta sp. MPI-SDFR-AT-0127]|nr:hypothetical protein BKA66DRAFT_447756 [Pyrenochaeta sp. MPI-SDFR-AT-0127]